MAGWGIRDLETRVTPDCSISGGGADCTVEVYMLEESEEGGVAVLRQGGAAPGVRTVKSSEFGEGKL